MITQTQAHLFGSTRDAPDSGKPFADNSWHPTAVAKYPPNGWGLHDMHGNVSEWVHDCYDDKAYAGGAPLDGRPHEWTGCELRVIRGGHRRDFLHALRSANRVSSRPEARALHTGFRLARNVP